MAKKKVRIDEQEADRLNRILNQKTVITKDSGAGRITRVTRGGIQVHLPESKKIRPYPLYDSFMSGELRFKESVYQEEMLRCLSEAANPTPSTAHPKVRQGTMESSEPRVTHVDVPGNVGLVCFFKDVDADKYIAHMKRVGLKGFDDSLERGFAEEPFVALRETEYFLGCSMHTLLYSNEEFLQQILKECFTSEYWNWTDPTCDRLDDGSPHRAIWCRHSDRKRRFLVHAVYDDEGMQHCGIMMVDLLEDRGGSSEMRTIQCTVLGPSRETVDAFEVIFNAAAKAAMGAAAPAKTSSGGVASSTNATTKAAPSTAARQKPGKAKVVQPKAIHVNEFLVRRSYGSHRTGGHSLEPIRATVSIFPKVGGDPSPVEFDAYRCPKCRKYFMTEWTYLRLKRQGYICCKVIEEKDLGTKKAGDGLYGNLASESVLHMYGYTVNQQDNLSEAERRTIISFVIENRIQTAQDIAHLLEWLISQREGNPRMALAVSRWRADLRFVKRYRKPTRKVRVDRIYAKV